MRKKLVITKGRPALATETRDMVVSFLERPDMSYCKPGRKDIYHLLWQRFRWRKAVPVSSLFIMEIKGDCRNV